MNRPNSPDEHGVGKSPLISNIPTGSKRRGKQRSQSRTNQSFEEEKSLSSNPTLKQREHSSKENNYSKHDSLSKLSETTSSKSVISTELTTNEKNSTSSRPSNNL